MSVCWAPSFDIMYAYNMHLLVNNSMKSDGKTEMATTVFNVATINKMARTEIFKRSEKKRLE